MRIAAKFEACESRLRKKRINVVKCLAISTGRLKPFRALHVRPINLVVYQGPLETFVWESYS